jgi:hypothetical protein
MQLSYQTVYDVAAKSYTPWRIGLAFLFCAVALILWRRSVRSQGAVRHWIMRTVILIVAAGGVIAATYEPASQGQLREVLGKGSAQIVQGVITDYTVADPAHKVPEHFTVQSADAAHYTFIMRAGSPGYHQTKATGSPLHSGQCVRLAVVGGAIGRVEIADHC